MQTCATTYRPGQYDQAAQKVRESQVHEYGSSSVVFKFVLNTFVYIPYALDKKTANFAQGWIS